jgi:D-tagatose-1,6-bisphosphate aldolase subunit GatZ/KbaZ
MDAATALRDLLRRNRAGDPVGITSVCSAHPMVLDIAMRRAAIGGDLLLIEATCNQVNQDGGYTGMTPKAFRDRQLTMADAAGLRRDRLLLGGDHLGPNPWRDRPADEAMDKARALVAAFAAGGYRKLHLDASMACADDASPLAAEPIATRAAMLCAVAERAAEDAGLPPPLYVIGTEVPTPGGAHGAEQHLSVTPPGDVAHTLALHRVAFEAAGCADAFHRAVAIVVRPGVEFGQDSVHDFAPQAAAALGAALSGTDMVFEAHSTDYQRAAALRALVSGHFAILKVGPELTFALREAIFALDRIATELGQNPGVRTALEQAMDRNPGWWRGYFAPADRVGRLFSLSDRVRYYWPESDVDAAVRRLMALGEIPPTLASQYLPSQHAAWRAGQIALTPAALIGHRVGQVLDRYGTASR